MSSSVYSKNYPDEKSSEVPPPEPASSSEHEGSSEEHASGSAETAEAQEPIEEIQTDSVAADAKADEEASAAAAAEDTAALEEARAFKARGNTHFKAGEYDPAIECYTQAIELAPPEEAERAVFLANRAACFAKINEQEAVIDDCTEALELQPDYVKALMRRALAREALERSEEALEDAKRAAEVDPGSKEAVAAVVRLEKASAAKLEAQKEEMLGKLKDLGNTVLGKFGMSLDNFKADKDPNTGSYNISFQR